MTNDEIKTMVLSALAAVAPELEPDKLAPGAILRDELDIDSMDALNFLVGLSKAFGIDIPEVDYRKLSTLDAIVAYVAARTGKR